MGRIQTVADKNAGICVHQYHFTYWMHCCVSLVLQNLTAIKAYVDILRQIDQTNPRVSVVSCGITEVCFYFHYVIMENNLANISFLKIQTFLNTIIITLSLNEISG